MKGYVSVTGTGICAFSNHNSLKKLDFSHRDCHITGDELEQLALGCSTLERIVFDIGWARRITVSVQDNILSQNCELEWKSIMQTTVEVALPSRRNKYLTHIFVVGMI